MPCIRLIAEPTSLPNATAIAWCPRQTPRIGNLPENSWIISTDTPALSGRPGIGPATAERIIAKLRRKVPRFALLAARDEPREADVHLRVTRHSFQ